MPWPLRQHGGCKRRGLGGDKRSRLRGQGCSVTHQSSCLSLRVTPTIRTGELTGGGEAGTDSNMCERTEARET